MCGAGWRVGGRLRTHFLTRQMSCKMSKLSRKSLPGISTYCCSTDFPYSVVQKKSVFRVGCAAGGAIRTAAAVFAYSRLSQGGRIIYSHIVSYYATSLFTASLTAVINVCYSLRLLYTQGTTTHHREGRENGGAIRSSACGSSARTASITRAAAFFACWLRGGRGTTAAGRWQKIQHGPALLLFWLLVSGAASASACRGVGWVWGTSFCCVSGTTPQNCAQDSLVL